MLDNISIGKYSKKDSIIHNMNPITKIIQTLLFSIFTIIQNDIYISLILLILVLLTLWLSKKSCYIFYKIIISTKYLLLFLLIINIINGFSIENYIVYVLKLLLVMVEANILITTTSLPDINYGIYKLLKPLSIFSKTLPNQISFTLTLSIRFIPTLLEETNKLLKAKKSRNVNLNKIDYKNKLKIMLVFLKQLFINTIKRADNISENMELREYSINNYQVYDIKKHFYFIDYFFITSYATILICIIIRGVLL